ncbi:MAG TPA: hypothetical protein VMZ28_00970 [Kofleriaceae bacterium]|nr:hypothetical protein [Kofleriaceae bacterium]
MRAPWRWALIGAAVLGLVAAGWLYRENRALERELASLRRSTSTSTSTSTSSSTSTSPSTSTGTKGLGGLLGSLGRATSRERPELDAPQEESRADRRRRRQEELRAMLGREPGESVADYRARVVPFIQTALGVPRMRLDEARKEAEVAAKVTDEQRAKLDALFDDVTRETLDLTNQAIADGDLTPYERNVGGVLQWGGGLGAILGSTQTRIGDILTPEQRQIMADQGFEWGEYLGVTMPWESLEPPPAPSDG